MTEQEPTVNDAQIDSEAVSTDTQTETLETEAPADQEHQNVNREAKYRTERNAARVEVAELQAKLAILQRAEVERLASAGLSHPSDIFTMSGNELAAYLTVDGRVDPEKVSADVAAILTERPGLRKPAPAVDRSQGSGNVAPGRSTPTFSDLFK